MRERPTQPEVVIVAGPNGAGKSTTAPHILKDTLGLAEFVNADTIARVRQRVACGGHHVPDEVVRRRYHRGLNNLLRLYIPRVTTWRVYNNARSCPMLLASSGGVADETTWNTIRSRHGLAE